MAIDKIISKSIGAIKTVTEKAVENDKGIVDFFASIGKTISELVDAKDKIEAKIAQFENEFSQIKARMEKKLGFFAIIISILALMQLTTLLLVIGLFLKK